MSRIAVIGAGIGGMCTAARLAAAGHKVEVYENSDRVGGKCHTEWFGDLAFDSGPTLLTLPAVFRDFFLKTGAPLDSVLNLQPVDPSFDYRFVDGARLQFPNLSRFTTLQTIRESLGEGASHDWSRIMARAGEIWNVSRQPFIESELDSIYSLLKTPSLLKSLRTIAPWKSLRSLISDFTSDIHLQYIIDRYATYSGSDPRRAPAALLSIAYVEEAFGAWHISGGIGQLSTAIYNRALERGVKFHLSARVSNIRHDGIRVLGLDISDGSKIDADVVVANADASSVYNSLIKGNERIFNKPRKMLKRAKPSVGGYSMFFESTEFSELETLNHHTVLFPKDYDDEFHSLFQKHQPATDPSIYICAPRDSRMSRDSKKHGVSVLVNAPRHSTNGAEWNWENAEFTKNYGDSIISSMKSRGIPTSHLKLLAIRTPADLEKNTLAPGGSIYGTSSNGVRAAFFRARNRSPLRGLFCVGGSAHPGGGLPLVAISAEIVSNMIGNS